jgi:hypothetical protein
VRVPRLPSLPYAAGLAGLGLVLGCHGGLIAPGRLDPTSPAALAAARDDYRAACAPCHGEDARGAGPVAPSLRTPPTDLTLLAARHDGTYPHDAVVATLAGDRPIDAHGTRAMPIWSLRLGGAESGPAVASIETRRRLEMLARYLATLQRPARP